MNGRRWDYTVVDYSREPAANAELQSLLDDGWEPFAYGQYYDATQRPAGGPMSTTADYWRHQIRWHISQAEECARSCATTITAHEAQLLAARATTHAMAAHAMSSGLQAEENDQ